MVTAAAALVSTWLMLSEPVAASGQDDAAGSAILQPGELAIEYMQVQGLRRTVRFHQPEYLAASPFLLLALHGSGGDGERFRRSTAGAFDSLADEYGFIVAYPDALGGQWNDCRARAPYHEALSGIDEIAFLRAVARRAEARSSRQLAGIFVVGYSNGGHLAFRLAFEAPGDFAAFAAIAANLPVAAERDCRVPERPVSMFLVSGTEDPVNPWVGGKIRITPETSFGNVLSAEQTADYFRVLAKAGQEPDITQYPDRDREDGTRVEARRWSGPDGHEVVLLVAHGGGHALPHPTAPAPPGFAGRISRDVDAASEVWKFFMRQQ